MTLDVVLYDAAGHGGDRWLLMHGRDNKDIEAD